MNNGNVSATRELLVYVEDAPLNDKTPATGLSKALVPMLDAMTGSHTRLVVMQTHEYRATGCFASCWFSHGFWQGSRVDYVLAKIAARLPLKMGCMHANWHGMWTGIRLRRQLPADTGSTMRLWAAIGVDPLSLVRASAAAKALGAALEVYCVDDLERHPANQRDPQLVGDIVHDMLRRSRRAYGITPGLCQVLSQRHGVPVHALPLIAATDPLPAAAAATTPDPSAFFGFYLGSVNHLYVPGLQALIAAMTRLRQQRCADLRLCLSSRRTQAEALLGALPEWVVCEPIGDSAALAQTMRQATFCYLPYGFDDSAREMTETSFPSKLLDYLPHARAILVYSPAYTVPARLFEEQGLPFVVTEPAQLEALLGTWALQGPDCNAAYRRVMDECFSAHTARAALGLDAA